MPKYSKSQRKTRRRSYRKVKSTQSSFTAFGKPWTPKKSGKVAKARYKSIW